jgi:hypothetical protein
VTLNEELVESIGSEGATQGIGRLAEEKSALVDEFSDRLAAFRLLSHTDDTDATDKILQEFGAGGKVERDIVHEISARAPLWMPEKFEEAHRLVMRALEVLDRNGARGVNAKMGVLTPVTSWLVQLITRFIVRNYQAEVITSIRNLYIRREANSAKDIPERFMLRRARIDAERMMPTLKKNPLGVPTFLLGGAAVSWLGSAMSSALEGTKTKVGLIVATMVMFLIFALLTWSILRGAAVARHRIKLTLDAPLKALWETIGACGKAPKDSARSFALIATILTVVAFVVLPIGIGLAFFR